MTEAGTSKLGGYPGLHNKPLGCDASEVYASGPACEEEEPHRCILIDYFNNSNFSKLEYAFHDDGDCNETRGSCFNVNFKIIFKAILLCISW